MSKNSVRHTTFSDKPEVAAKQAAENARDVNDLFARKVTGYLVTVPRYAAVGASTAKIKLEQLATNARPAAVQLARARATNDPGGNLTGVSGSLNFYHDSSGIGVYEPSGLTANVKYDLTFLVLE